MDIFFRWPHLSVSAVSPPILLLVLPIQPFTMYTMQGRWMISEHVSHMLGMYGVEMSSYFFSSL